MDGRGGGGWGGLHMDGILGGRAGRFLSKDSRTRCAAANARAWSSTPRARVGGTAAQGRAGRAGGAYAPKLTWPNSSRMSLIEVPRATASQHAMLISAIGVASSIDLAAVRGSANDRGSRKGAEGG